MPQRERPNEITFPFRGVDLSLPHAEQQRDTTPVGQNVRAHEPATDRLRGGSRSGLSKYIALQPSGTNLIQHLNIIVDPTTPALLDQFDYPGGEPDPSDGPRNPGRIIRPGGTGRQPNRNTTHVQAGFAFVQAKAQGFSTNAPGGNEAITFDSDVTAGDLIVVSSELADTTSATFIGGVTDSQGNTYTALRPANINGQIWWAIAGSSGPLTVTLAITVGAGTSINQPVIAEYSGNHAAPADGSVDTNDTNTAWTTGSIAVSQIDSLVLGVFITSELVGFDPPLPTMTPGAGFNERLESIHEATSGPFTFRLLTYLVDTLDADSATAVTATASASFLYTAAGASFKPA
jgi:hypothetical protein